MDLERWPSWMDVPAANVFPSNGLHGTIFEDIHRYSECLRDYQQKSQSFITQCVSQLNEQDCSSFGTRHWTKHVLCVFHLICTSALWCDHSPFKAPWISNLTKKAHAMLTITQLITEGPTSNAELFIPKCWIFPS